MIPVRGFAGAKVLVLGLGRSGLALARALQAGGAIPLCWDDGAEGRARAEDAGFALQDPLKAGAFEGVACLSVSPGIPHLYPKAHPAISAAWEAGVPVDNDIGLFFRSLATPEWERFDTPPRVIAVTGSNGKSTTSALIHHLATEEGLDSQLAGNIGRGVFDIDPPGDGGLVVLELSSYQTDLARTLTPDIAVFTNLSPDHLDRHGGMGGYFAAKKRLFVEGGPDRAIIGVDEPEGLALLNTLSMGRGDDRVIPVSVARKLDAWGWSVFVRKGFLSEYRKGRQVGSVDLRQIPGLPGRHNHQNAAHAYAALRALGRNPRNLEKGLASFAGLPHRSQIIAQHRGVTFVNDSKATNAESAAQALQAFKSIRWIAGGLGKEGGLGAALDHLAEVRKAYLIGHSARDFALQLGTTPHEISETMESAVAAALAEAEEGDTIMLAPAAASFDQYPDFEKRGAAFVAAAKAAIAGEKG